MMPRKRATKERAQKPRASTPSKKKTGGKQQSRRKAGAELTPNRSTRRKTQRKEPPASRIPGAGLVSMFRGGLRRLFSVPVMLGLGVLAVVMVLAFDMHTISSLAMQPGLTEGDVVLVDRAAAEFGTPALGDVVLIRNPDDRERELLVRVVAEQEDIVRLDGGEILINGEPIVSTGGVGVGLGASLRGSAAPPMVRRRVRLPNGDEHDVLHRLDTIERHQDSEQLTVPRGHIWVLGDNRDAAYDSRAFGAVPIADVTGKVRIVLRAADADGWFGPWIRWLE